MIERRDRTWHAPQCSEPCCESSGKCKTDGAKGKKSKRKESIPDSNDRRGKISWESCNGKPGNWTDRNGKVEWSDRNGKVDWSQRNGKVDFSDRKAKKHNPEPVPGCSTSEPVADRTVDRRRQDSVPDGPGRRERRSSEGSNKSHKKEKRKSSMKKVPTVTKETLDGKDYYLVVLVMPETDS